MSLSLYLHLPYCARRCPYCDFAISTDPPSAAYAQALRHEIASWGRKLHHPTLDTVHLGGGTPSRMPVEFLAGILGEVQEAFKVAPGAEIALEANPDDAALFQELPGLGVNRLSIGAQSFDDAELACLGRTHNAAQTERAFHAARRAGFRNLSLDLIYGLPGQDMASWTRTLEKSLVLDPEHLSVYALTLTGAKMLKGPACPDEAAQAALAREAMQRLERRGFVQYEISNFAKPGFESRHNLAYWTFKPYLGLGVGAHSYLPPRRFANVAQTPVYLARMAAGQDPQGMEEAPTAEQTAIERIFLGLRLAAGLDPVHLPAEAAGEVDLLLSECLLERRKGRLALTPRGRLLVDAVTGRLVRCLPSSKAIAATGA